jgi:hypothetical protein
MTRLLGLLGAFVLFVGSLGQANATSISEEIVLTYSSSGPFSISSLSFGAGGDVIIPSFSFSSPSAGSGTLLTEVASLQSGTVYTLNFSASLPLGPGLRVLEPSGTSQTISSSYTGSDGSYSLNLSVSPVPLPASAPLFILALISLAAFGYHTGRKTIRFAA